MEIIKYLERVTIIRNTDGTVRGSEAHEHTGYFEERAVPDAPGGKQMVFVVVKPEVRPVAAGDLAEALGAGATAIEDAAAKAETILHLQQQLETTGAQLVSAEKLVEAHAATIAGQAAVIVERDVALSAGAAREQDLRIALQRAERENAAIMAELVAARAATAAQDAAPVE